jgi:hypothetical protein
LGGGAAWVLAAPSADLGAVKHTVMVGVHLIEADAGALRRPLLGALDELIPSDAPCGRGGRRRLGRGRCGRALDGCGLRYGLSKGRCGQQTQPEQGYPDQGCNDNRAHLLRLSVDDAWLISCFACERKARVAFRSCRIGKKAGSQHLLRWEIGGSKE